jgi:hypothetical protein
MVTEHDLLVSRERHRALYAVLQLAHVPRPGVGQDLVGRLRGKPPHLFLAHQGEVLDEVLRQEEHIGRPLP